MGVLTKEPRSGRFSRRETELDNLPTVLRRDPFLFPLEVVRYIELDDLRHCRPLLPDFLLTPRDPTIPTRTDNEQNRIVAVFATAPCRPHMTASTSSFPLTYWTHRGSIATSHSCHLIDKNRAADSYSFSSWLGDGSELRALRSLAEW
jgi:hypothetical protein